MTNGVPPHHRLSLHDHVALDEIELYAEVLIAVADADRPLRPAEIDQVLGLAPAPPPARAAAATDTAPSGRGDEPTRPPGPSGPTGPPSRMPGRGPDPAPPPPDERESDTTAPPRGSALVPEPRPLPAPLPAPGLPWTVRPLAYEVPLPSAPAPPPTALWAH
ncbi:hypothetical protein [Nocardiopsis aegyptia]|uniref:Uncharacterized protein n=1 Tax=Nocardiopsis aegyptia TaxID=220378 RepID=A0A7Z0JAZ0_9ACTN|nr:hypothetical protein [Nocardiopsis aegyptia]NYJ35641.1 hypothetical protein [Nocardiopsis aegyptia]